jgi:O-antigen ligase
MIFNTSTDKILFYNIPIVLFTLLPIFLISGPLLSDLSVSLISLLFLIYCFKTKKFVYFKNKYFYFFLLFWFYLILNSLINNFNIDSFKISIFYFRYGVFAIAIATLLEIDDKIIKYFFYCVLFCFLILLIDGFYQYFIGENILGWKTKFSYRVSSFFYDELILGSYLSRLWPVFFAISIITLKKKDKLFFLVMVVFSLSEVLIFLSGERVAFFYINLSAIFVIFLSNKLQKLRLIIFLFSMFIIIIISFLNPTAKERLIDNTLLQMNITAEGKKEKNKNQEIFIFSKQHQQIYVTSYKIFQDNKIFGVGVKNFRNFCSDKKYVSKDSCSTHPHNFYLQILTETGIIGFLFLISVCVYFIKYILKHLLLKIKGKYFFSDFEICLLSGILIFLWPMVPTGNVFNNWLNIIIALYLPFLIWSRKKSIKFQRKSK